jgi:hypothetical protein
VREAKEPSPVAKPGLVAAKATLQNSALPQHKDVSLANQAPKPIT